MLEINKLSLKNFYEQHKVDYLRRRKSGDIKLWDESYKWSIFPKLNNKLSSFDSVSKETISALVQTLKKHNPSSGSFAHWIDMDDLKLLSEKANGFQIFREIWHKNPANIGQAIDEANAMSLFMLNKKFSPSTFGYLLAAQDCDKYAIYLDKLIKDIAELNLIKISGSLSQGEKYQLLNDSATYIGELMQSEIDQYADQESFTALNGQDFLYVSLQYPE